MKFLEDKHILQRPEEPPRRFFTDSDHFDIFIWYSSKDFTDISGFQLVYRANPFNTDEEFYISHWPGDEDDHQLHLGKTAGPTPMHPAPKMIRKTNEEPPASLIVKFNEKNESLPDEVREYLLDLMSPILK